MKTHPYADKYPMLPADELAELTQSIRAAYDLDSEAGHLVTTTMHTLRAVTIGDLIADTPEGGDLA